MRMLYHDLIGRHVITADGRRVGRIADLRAEPRDGRLRVTHLLVGARALIERIGRSEQVTEVSWSLVRRVGERVELRITSAELQESWEETLG